MKLVDLTHTFGAVMPVYPGDPVPELRQFAFLGKEGYVDHEVRTGMHVGTHMDAPGHMLAGGKFLSEFPPEKFIGRGRLIDARGKTAIGEELLLDTTPMEKGDIVFVLTGFSERFGQKAYFESYPEISEAFAKRICDAGVKILGMDTPSPDRSPFPVHQLLLSHEVLIIENLTNLAALVGVPLFEVTALPVKFHADAAPVRVIAKI
jgi:kynurenine formamidase